MAIQGKQVPYTPKYQVKSALTYSYDNLLVTPIVRYVSTRYGLANDSQAVSPYAVVDLNASYDIGKKLGWTSIVANFGVTNLLNHTYIGAISVNEDNLSSTSYYVAPPRTFYGGLTAKF